MRLLLLGCSGFVGRGLVPELLLKSHQLTIVSRNPKPFRGLADKVSIGNFCVIKEDPTNPKAWEEGPLLEALREAEGVVNLVGEPIADKRWTVNHCKKIKSSRLDTTRLLVHAMKILKRPPRVLVNGSAIGFYGTSQDLTFTETSESGNDFLANLCTEWESAAQEKPRSTRLLVVRIGLVLGHDGGILGKMLPFFRAGMGGPIGSGLQWMSWIHRDDLSRIICQAIENRAWSGVVNGVAPNVVTMKHFSAALGQSLSRPSLIPVPGAILKLILGDGARVVLEGQKVESMRLRKLGFDFNYVDIGQALSDLTCEE